MVNKSELNSTGVVIDGVELTNEERQPCEVWTRVMGYYRPVSFYNTGKKGEYHERVEFVEPGSCCVRIVISVSASGWLFPSRKRPLIV